MDCSRKKQQGSHHKSEVAEKSVSAHPGPIPENAREQDGTKTGRDGPHLGTWMGPEMLENKAHGESGRDPFGPGMGPGRAQDRTQTRVWMAPPETVTDF